MYCLNFDIIPAILSCYLTIYLSILFNVAINIIFLWNDKGSNNFRLVMNLKYAFVTIFS